LHDFFRPFCYWSFVVCVILLNSCCTPVIRCLYGWYRFCSVIFIFIFYKNK
jgi:hypothetical protein